MASNITDKDSIMNEILKLEQRLESEKDEASQEMIQISLHELRILLRRSE